MRRSAAKKPENSGQTIMNHLDPAVETLEEDLFRHQAIVVRLLLSLPGLSQDRLAELSGIGQNLISLYQRGKLIPSPETLEQLAKAADWSLSLVEHMAAAAIRYRNLPGTYGPLRLESPAAQLGRKIAILAEASFLEIELLMREKRSEPPQTSPPSANDAIAEDLWGRIADLDDRQRRLLIDFSTAFHRPSLALRLAQEADRLAVERPKEAAQLTQLAEYVAKLCAGGVPS